MLSVALGGVKMDGSRGSITQIAKIKWIVTKIKDHNADKEDCCLKQNTPTVIGKHVNKSKKVFHLNITMQHMLLQVI